MKEMTERKKLKSLLFQSVFNPKNLEVLPCLLIVAILFIPALFRPWLIYDERSIFEGTHFATPSSFGEFFEILENFGLNFNIVSSNTIYSSNYITRTAPLGQFIGMTLSFLFKNNPFFYHLFNLTFHLINTFLVYLILKTLLYKDTLNKTPSLMAKCFVLVLPTVWAVHPTMVEPVLLSTNFGALISYFFFFVFVLDFLLNKERNQLYSLRRYLIPFIFLIPMMINEYIVTLPLTLFIISFYFNHKQNPFKAALKKSLEETQPYFYGLILYVVYFVLFTHYQSSHQFTENGFIVFLERVFWLAPQIFLHCIKLIFYPKLLSIDQTILVKLGDTLSSPYALFCIAFFMAWLFIPLTLFILKRKLSNLFLLCWTFFFTLLPFLHILMPSYALVAERYLYCSLAFFVICSGKIIYELVFVNASNTYKSREYITIVLLSVILTASLVRSFYRTSDWKDNFSFITASYKTSNDPLFKAVRLGMLAKTLSVYEPSRREEIRDYFIQALTELKKAKLTTIEKRKHQNQVPLVIKSYGNDYDSLLAKIAFLEASTVYLDFKGDYKFALSFLEPYVKNVKKTDPRVLELYAHLLAIDKNYKKAEKVLLAANATYPNNNFILGDLVDFYTTTKKDNKLAEKYLTQALRLYAYDPSILQKAISFYKEQKNSFLAARFAYLHGLRTQSKLAYQIALSNYLDVGDLRDAKKTIAKLQKLKANDPETLYFTSKYYHQIKDKEKALYYMIEAFKATQAPNTDPKLRFDIAHNLAKLYAFFGNKETAIQLSQGFLELAGNDRDSLIKLAKLYKSLGLNKETQVCITKIKSLKG